MHSLYQESEASASPPSSSRELQLPAVAATIKGKPSDQVSKPSIQVSKISPILVDMGCARCGISHACKVMLKILQARLQRYVNHEFPDVQAGFRKGRGTRDQSANIRWIIEKTRGSRKTSISALLTIPKPLTVWITIKCGKF